MRKVAGISVCLALATAGLVGAGAQGTRPAAPAPAAPAIDRSLLHVQVILDRLGFGPGVLDGRPGKSLTAALKGFQQQRDLTVTGTLDQATLRALYPYRAWRPTQAFVLTPEALAGPYVNPMPEEPAQQAKLPAMAYRNPVEKLAERFHTTPAVLIALNGGGTRLAPGTRLIVPNAVPESRAYADNLPEAYRRTLSDLNVSAVQPRAARVVVDKSDEVLRAYDADGKLVAQFMATMGSAHDPLPIGRWKILGIAYNPEWKMNPEILRGVDKSQGVQVIPPGPNSPVGVVWIDLNKPHYGIHGTAEPDKIGRAESNGCIRLTNWDAARLSLMVRTGVPAVFQP